MVTDNQFHPDWDQIKPFNDRIAELEKVAKQALEALKGVIHAHGYNGGTPVEAITALHRALEQPAQQKTDHDIPDLIAGALGVSRGTAYDLMREALAEQQEPVANGLPLVIAGAIFDFAGYLTTRDTVIEVGSTANASPVADLVKDWATLRGLSLADAAVLSWQEWLTDVRANDTSKERVDEMQKQRHDTTPPQPASKPWVGLTEEDVLRIKGQFKGTLDVQFDKFAYAIEAKLREKNGGGV